MKRLSGMFIGILISASVLNLLVVAMSSSGGAWLNAVAAVFCAGVAGMMIVSINDSGPVRNINVTVTESSKKTAAEITDAITSAVRRAARNA